jgi:hypothetical protein
LLQIRNKKPADAGFFTFQQYYLLANCWYASGFMLFFEERGRTRWIDGVS